MALAAPTASDDLAVQLERQTQELLDAVASGNREPWTRYLHEDLIYTAEDGTIKSKAQIVEEVQPLPKQIWGKLRVTRFRTVRHCVNRRTTNSEQRLTSSDRRTTSDEL